MNKVKVLAIFILSGVVFACIFSICLGGMMYFSCGDPQVWSQEQKKFFYSAGILFLFTGLAGALFAFNDKKLWKN
jgi:hypothetical protein